VITCFMALVIHLSPDTVAPAGICSDPDVVAPTTTHSVVVTTADREVSKR